MEKDEYAHYKARADLAVAFVNKLEKMSIEDTNIIPALYDWVESADNNLFQEYKDFHFGKSIAEREKELETLKKKVAEIEKAINEEKEKYDKYVSDYEEYFKQKEEWRCKILEEADQQNPCPPSRQLTLGIFFSSLEAKVPNWKIRTVAVDMGGKLVSCCGVSLIKNRLVFELDQFGTALYINPPKAPSYIRKEIRPKGDSEDRMAAFR